MMKIVALVAALCIFQASASPIDAFQKAVHPKDLVIPESRIVNGFFAQAGQFPYQTTVVSAGGSFCGGSLISTTWVLTAAHCVSNQAFTIGLGSINRLTQTHSYQAAQIISHPAYNPNTLNNDMALIRLPVDVPLSGNIQPVRLPTQAQANVSFQEATATVSGFGRFSDTNNAISNELRFVQLRIISNAECAGVYGGATVVAHVICARGLTAANQGTCNGDSGGPLTLNEGGVSTQIGVVSFVAAAGCEAGLPSGYMRTASFLAWVNQHTGIPIRN